MKIKLMAQDSPEENWPLRPRHNQRLIIDYQRFSEDEEQHNSECDENEDVCRSRERHEELQRSNLPDQKNRNHDDEDVNAHAHVDV